MDFLGSFLDQVSAIDSGFKLTAFVIAAGVVIYALAIYQNLQTLKALPASKRAKELSERRQRRPLLWPAAFFGGSGSTIESGRRKAIAIAIVASVLCVIVVAGYLWPVTVSAVLCESEVNACPFPHDEWTSCGSAVNFTKVWGERKQCLSPPTHIYLGGPGGGQCGFGRWIISCETRRFHL
jgi:hypothetical protein